MDPQHLAPLPPGLALPQVQRVLARAQRHQVPLAALTSSLADPQALQAWLTDEGILSPHGELTQRGQHFLSSTFTDRRATIDAWDSVARALARCRYLDRADARLTPYQLTHVGLFGSLLDPARATHGDADLIVGYQPYPTEHCALARRHLDELRLPFFTDEVGVDAHAHLLALVRGGDRFLGVEHHHADILALGEAMGHPIPARLIHGQAHAHEDWATLRASALRRGLTVDPRPALAAAQRRLEARYGTDPWLRDARVMLRAASQRLGERWRTGTASTPTARLVLHTARCGGQAGIQALGEGLREAWAGQPLPTELGRLLPGLLPSLTPADQQAFAKLDPTWPAAQAPRSRVRP